ncbi:electron transport complex subunit RsxC [Aestuariirhabdus litorea]|uniref:Ion-translocating oxidoreductase complex subunit C n=1 Tax=Aestuariirhabdus litorea TaxID=2528527 RepID=A0A3P3VJL8_9GAMM|nr:electron transport complex subunit RsxC [Aestuariirhabdus litorea]RRJ82910.1 electron transport complex subunit RsxC [Aestuariirhabdus litorea]RWW93069.1 electron transport complex subunit RsxC [Endozoicomonadaceae bacterium GTF-13]
MKLFGFRGGVHPHARKERTEQLPIIRLPLPRRLYVPLQQHIGEPAVAQVRPGQPVKRGELIGGSVEWLSAPVHAPADGTVVEVSEFASPHPAALPVTTAVIEVSAHQTPWRVPAEDPFGLSPAELALRIRQAGIVGMGGATFPSAVKLDLARQHGVDTLIINGGECEPYLTCDDRLMRERGQQIVTGVALMLRCLEARRALILVEDNKEEALATLRTLCREQPQITTLSVPTRYPQGSQKQMIQSVLGREIPAGGHATDLGVVMHNVATAYAVYEALVDGKPLVSRIVTVGGGAVPRPANLEVPLGTLVEELLAYCGLEGEAYERLLVGGPMMGQWLPHPRVPVIKGSSGIIALSEAETRVEMPRPCIRCSRCVEVCPSGLLPLELAKRIRKEQFAAASELGLSDCIACGSCAYVCPAKIPLVQYFHYGKGQLQARRVQEKKLDNTADLAATKAQRLAEIEAQKAAAAQARKREAEARARQQAAEKAAAHEAEPCARTEGD